MTSKKLPILMSRDLRRTRGVGDKAFTLSIPELDVYSGDFIALVGPSGSGKSTLLDLLALVLRPTGGTSMLLYNCRGHAIDILDCWKRRDDRKLAQTRRNLLGYVLQTGGLLPYLNVAGNIELPVRLLGQRLNKKQIDAQLMRFGLDGYGDKRPCSLSGGERQRVAILRALSHRPSLILADEPTAALDRKHARTVVEHFKLLAREQSIAVVMVTHDELLVSGLADTIVRFVANDTADEGFCYVTEVQQAKETPCAR